MAATKLAYTTRTRRDGTGRINTRLITENWDEVPRVAASIRHGMVSAALIMRKLAAYPRQNQIARALHVMGRLEKTLFILELLLDPQLRRRDGRGLNDRRPDGQTLDEVEVCHRFSHSDAGADAREASRRPRDQPTSTTSKPTSSPTGRCSQAATAMIAAPASRTAIMAGVMWRLI